MYATPSSRRGLAGPPAGASGDVVSVGGDLAIAPEGGLALRADDTGQLWHVLDIAGTGWAGIKPMVSRGMVRGIVTAPYTIGQVQAASVYRADQRGTTSFQALAQSNAQPAVDLSIVPYLVTSATDPNSQGWNATVNRNIWDAFVAELERQHAAGKVSDTAYAHALTLKDDPVAATKNGYFLPPGVTAVPMLLQGDAITVSGSIHPDALAPQEQANLAAILNYTAAMKGTTYAQEADKLADHVRSTTPGQTFAGVDALLDGIKNKKLVQLTPDVATNTVGQVDLRPAEQRAADPYGVGAGSAYYALAPEGTPGQGNAPEQSGPLVASLASTKALPWLLGAAALGLVLIPSQKRRS